MGGFLHHNLESVVWLQSQWSFSLAELPLLLSAGESLQWVCGFIDGLTTFRTENSPHKRLVYALQHVLQGWWHYLPFSFPVLHVLCRFPSFLLFPLPQHLMWWIGWKMKSRSWASTGSKHPDILLCSFIWILYLQPPYCFSTGVSPGQRQASMLGGDFIVIWTSDQEGLAGNSWMS